MQRTMHYDLNSIAVVSPSSFLYRNSLQSKVMIMKILGSAMVFLAMVLCVSPALMGQETELPKPGPEFDLLQADAGTWDVEIKAWQGPGEPTVSKGKETNRMLGAFWLVSDFQGNMMGLEFSGHGVYGYDQESKKYVGTWFDSLGPKKMDLVGTHDKASNTLTLEGIGPGVDGQPAKHLITTKYNDDGTHRMTMQMAVGDEMIKVFEMKYTRSK